MDQLSRAIVVWTGWDTKAWPSPDDERVVAEFGLDAALDLLPTIRQLHDEFYDVRARDPHTGALFPALALLPLREAADRAVSEFRERHPEISKEAVDAFAWCFKFDFK